MAKRYTMYLDESGVAALTSKKKEHLVLASVIVNQEEDQQWATYFNFIKRRYKLNESAPFHSVDIFEATRHPQYIISDKKSKALCTSLAEFLRVSPIAISVLSLNKEVLRKFLGIPKDVRRYFSGKNRKEGMEDNEIAYEILATRAFMEFTSFLSKNNNSRKGRIIAESRSGDDIYLLNAFNTSRYPQKFSFHIIQALSEKFGKCINFIGFEGKGGLRGGLEIADLIAYTSSVYYRYKNKSLRSKEIKVLWEKRGIKEVWKVISTKIDTQQIKKIGRNGRNSYSWYLPKNRAHTISKKVRWWKNNNLLRQPVSPTKK